MNIVKVGGNQLDEVGFIERFARKIAALNEPVLVVHGGGKAISELQQQLGQTPQKVEGLRVTDEQGLAVTQMVLSGSVNKRLVQALLSCGVQAVGLSGVDAGLLRCSRKRYGGRDLGLVGEVKAVNSSLLRLLLAAGYTVVVSPVSLGYDGQIYNVNADEAAGAIAGALGADCAWFISNVAAVLDAGMRPIELLYLREAQRLISEGVIRDGMTPKVRTALQVVEAGVRQAIITNVEGFENGRGTRFLRSLV